MLLLRLAEALKLFDIPFALTGGGPGIATQSYSLSRLPHGPALLRPRLRQRHGLRLLVVVMIVITLFFKRVRVDLCAEGRHTGLRNPLVDSLCWILAIVATLIFIFPIYWAFSTVAAQPDRHLHRRRHRHPVGQLHSRRSTTGSHRAQHARDGLRALRNSTFIAVCATMLALVLGTPAAYALARFRFRRCEQRDITVWFLSQRVLPPVATVIPFYLTFMRRSACSTRTWR